MIRSLTQSLACASYNHKIKLNRSINWVASGRRRKGSALLGLTLFSGTGDISAGAGNSLEVEDFSTLMIPDGFMAEPITARSSLVEHKHLMRHRMEIFILNVQKKVFESLIDLERQELKNCSNLDSGNKDERDAPNHIENIISIDRWTRKEGGGGITCIIQNGLVFEKAGVNISVVHGILPPAAVQQMKSRGKHFSSNLKEVPFFAAGVSSVIHPKNPHVPTIHFNYRYFEVDQSGIDNSSGGSSMWWFGGGTDLTPYLLDEGDCKLFHTELKIACDKHDASYYSRFKKWCDDYFYIVHRDERRGVGGLFFDDLDYPNQEKAFGFVRSCAHHILPSYLPIVKKNMKKPYESQDREWQLIRRGRYTEFNLVYDRGTKFGLVTPGARYESILMSLPLYAKWLYCHEPEAGSNYDKLVQVLRKPRDWV